VATDAVVAPVATDVIPPKSNDVLHVVELNQDLNSIAMMYGVRAEEVMTLNNLTSPDVKPGQTLKIPPPVE
jgi:LysM repeat protein